MGGGEVGWGDGGWRGIILVWADRWQSIRIRHRGVNGRCPPGPRPPSSSSYHRAAALGMTRCAKMAARRPTVGGILSPCPPVARRRRWAVPPLLLLPSTLSRFPKLVVGGGGRSAGGLVGMAKPRADADADDDDDDHHGREGARVDSADNDVARLKHHVSFLRECARASGLLGEVDDLSFKTNFALSSPPPAYGVGGGMDGGGA